MSRNRPDERHASPGLLPVIRIKAALASASGRKTSPVRPPLAISGPVLRRFGGSSLGGMDIADGETYDLGQPEADPQSKRIDQMVTGIAGRGAKNRPLLAVGQGWWGKERHRDSLRALA